VGVLLNPLCVACVQQPDFELVTLNFSSSTEPDLIMRSLTHYCKTERTPRGTVFSLPFPLFPVVPRGPDDQQHNALADPKSEEYLSDLFF
jgi:hypothetical protein